MNSNQLINNAEALRLFFNDDVYLVGGNSSEENNFAALLPVTNHHEKEHISNPNKPVSTLPNLVEATVDTYKQTFNFKHLGKNERGILILVNDAENQVSTPQGTELLRKLVLAINLKTADFALVNYANYTDATFEHLVSFFSCKWLFSFGVTPPTLGLNEMTLHQLTLVNDISMIFTHNLHQLNTDLDAKKTLWGTLKNLSI